MDSSVSYELEHFYYGQLVHNGKPDGDLRLLAASSGVRAELAADVVKQALIPPLKGVPDGAWALVRGKKIPFIMAQSQIGEAGQSMVHFVLMPTDMLRALGGNLDVMMGLIEQQMRVFDRLGSTLPALLLPQVGPPEKDAQIDHILDLMTATKNRLDVIEQVLSAIVRGVQIVVQGAPEDLRSRTSFIKGLLALLPPPARFGVTFTTHSVASTQVDAQIRFYSTDTPPTDTLVYHWPEARLEGKLVEDEYSHFIVSQLRLDAELVSRQTQILTPVAAWRIKRGDTLAEALAYGSHRIALDNSLTNNLPVESAEVAKVLGEDPTLDDTLRVAYARHLLAFALALGNMEPAEPVAILLRQHTELGQATIRQLDEALSEGKAQLVYDTLKRWLANPLGPEGVDWIKLSQRAIVARMEELTKAGDTAAMNTFLEEVHKAAPGVEISAIVPRLVELTLPFSGRDVALAQTIFLLAVNYLDVDVVTRLLNSPKFTAQLPKGLARLVPFLSNADRARPPSGLLAEVAGSFGDHWKPLVLIRMAEVAMKADRRDLLDAPALSGLSQVALSPWGLQYDPTLGWIGQHFSTDTALQALDRDGARYLLQILLARGAYVELANEMIHHSRLLYPGDLQGDYALMVQQVFADTNIPVDQAPIALAAIEKAGIKSLPLAMAYIGSLQGHDWAVSLDKVAESVTTNLFENRNILKVIDPKPMLALLRFHLKQRDMQNAARLSGLFADVAINSGKAGVAMLIRMFKMMDGSPKLRMAALEVLRRFIRDSESAFGRQSISVFGRELGQDVRHALEATYAMKRLLGGVDFVDYAEFIHITGEFLQDTAMSYIDKTNVPTLGALMNTMQSLTGGISDTERQNIARGMLALGRAIVVLGDQHRHHAPRGDSDKHIENLLAGKADPHSGLEVLYVIGGYFAKGRRFLVKYDRPSVYPLRERSAPMVRDEAEIVNQLLRGLIQTFPPDQEVKMTAEALRGEIESLWGAISLHQQREVVRALAIDFQRVAELTLYISEHGDDKALVDTTLGNRLDAGKLQPKSTLEFYRYVHGYFRST